MHINVSTTSLYNMRLHRCVIDVIYTTYYLLICIFFVEFSCVPGKKIRMKYYTLKLRIYNNNIMSNYTYLLSSCETKINKYSVKQLRCLYVVPIVNVIHNRKRTIFFICLMNNLYACTPPFLH